MKKGLSVFLALIIFVCGNFGLSIQAQAALNLTPIALNYTVKDVDVGDTFTLRATVPQDSMGTLDWSSSNTSVATVADSGTVTGHQLGTAVITATYTTAGGNIGRAMCTVYVTVADGLYYIKNAYSDLCMLADGSRITIQPQQTEINGRNRQLWKIEHESQGQYSIYPIWDTSLMLTNDGTNYVAIGVPESEACWGIAQGTGGYSIQYLGNGDQIAKPVVASTPGSLVYLGQWQDSLSCHWELEEAAGLFVRNTETQQIMEQTDILFMELGDNAGFSDLGLVCETYGTQSGVLQYASGDGNIASFATTGKLEGKNRGRVNISVSATLDGAVYTQSFDMIVRETISVINVMDSTISDEIYNDISGAVNFLNEIYDAYFLHFVSDGAPYLDPWAAVDNCPHGNEIDCDNDCGDLCDNHHFNVNRIAEDLYERFWRKNAVVVMWSNSPFNVFCWCYERAGTLGGIVHSHQPLGAYAVQSLSKNSDGELIPMPVVQMININNGVTFGENCTQLQLMAIVLAHEVAHTLGLEEMYDNPDYPDHDGADTKMLCIMEAIRDENRDHLSTFYQQIMLDGVTAFCSTCLNKLLDIPNDAYER